MTTNNLPSEAVALPGSAAAVVAWRAQGQLQLTVVAKATFAFARDIEMPLGDPQEILRTEVHHGNNPGRSIRFSTDLAPYLGRVDVLFTGAAHAPPGNPTQSLAVRLAVFTPERTSLDKSLQVKDTAGFERMPLVYERAFGGIDNQDNPVGTGHPNVVDPADPRRPVGFGPISRTWPARKRLLGETPRRVLDGAIAEIPAGFDWSYFQAAPPDQRIEALRGDEWILLDGLHPTSPRLQMRLPGARGRARIHGLAPFGVPEGRPVELRLDTLRIDGDEGRCTLVWRQSVPLADEAALAAVRVVAGVELPGAPLAWPEALPDRRAVAARSAVPGAPANVDIASVEVAPDASGVAAPLMGTLIPSEELGARNQPALPFLPPNLAASASAPAIALAPSEPQEHVPSGTLSIVADDADALRRPAVPFVGAADKTQGAPFVATPGAAPATPALPWSGAAPTSPSVSARHASPWSGAAPVAASSAPATTGQPAAASPPPVAPAMVAAVPLSALEASNAAADPQKAPHDPAAAAEEPGEAPDAGGDVLDLLWFDPKILSRVRKQSVWRDLLDGLEDKPHDPDIDAPGLDDGRAGGEDRRAIFEILTHGTPLGPAALRASLKGAIRADRRFVAPLVLLTGDLSFPFDEVETLKALAAAATPFASGDGALQGAIEGARELVKTPDLAMIPEVVDGATARLREAYAKGKRPLPLTEIEAQADRALLKQRRYQRRPVFGGPQLRALFVLPGERDAIPVYLPVALEAALPMYQRFGARLLAEAHLATDQHEAHPVALRVVALARASAPAHAF